MFFFYNYLKKNSLSQSQFPDVDDNEIKEMDIRITKLTELVQSKQEENRKLETGKKAFHNKNVHIQLNAHNQDIPLIFK